MKVNMMKGENYKALICVQTFCNEKKHLPKNIFIVETSVLIQNYVFNMNLVNMKNV